MGARSIQGKPLPGGLDVWSRGHQNRPVPGRAEPGSPGAVLLAQAPRGHELCVKSCSTGLRTILVGLDKEELPVPAVTSCPSPLLKHHWILPWLTPTFPVKSNGKGSPKTDFAPWQITWDKERIRFGHLFSGLTSSEKPHLALVVQWPMCHGIHQGSSPKPLTQTTKRQWRHKNYKFGPPGTTIILQNPDISST